MIVDIKSVYYASVRMPGKSRAEGTFVEGNYRIAIREIPDDEAPVVARWTTDPQEGDGKTLLRQAGGRFYTQAGVDGFTARDLLVSGDWTASDFLLALRDVDTGRYARGEGAIGVVTASEEAAMVEAMTVRAEQLLWIDGAAWQPTVEPVIRLSDRRMTWVKCAFPVGDVGFDTDETFTFRLDELDRAIAFGLARAAAAGREKDVRLEADVEILDGFASGYGDQLLRKDILAKAYRLIAREDTKRMHTPRDVVNAWADFRDAWVLADRSPRNGTFDLLLSTWKTFLELRDRDHEQGPAMTDMDLTLAPLAARWDDMEIGLEMGDAPSAAATLAR